MSSRALPGFFLILLGLAMPVAAGDGEPVLTARPGLCILQQADATQCVMAVELRWNSKLTGSYCLHQSISEAPLRCWQDARQGQHHSELNSRVDVNYWLQRKPSPQHLAEISVRVVSLTKRNPERRRRRHVWSVL